MPLISSIDQEADRRAGCRPCSGQQMPADVLRDARAHPHADQAAPMIAASRPAHQRPVRRLPATRPSCSTTPPGRRGRPGRCRRCRRPTDGVHRPLRLDALLLGLARASATAKPRVRAPGADKVSMRSPSRSTRASSSAPRRRSSVASSPAADHLAAHAAAPPRSARQVERAGMLAAPAPCRKALTSTSVSAPADVAHRCPRGVGRPAQQHRQARSPPPRRADVGLDQFQPAFAQPGALRLESVVVQRSRRRATTGEHRGRGRRRRWSTGLGHPGDGGDPHRAQTNSPIIGFARRSCTTSNSATRPCTDRADACRLRRDHQLARHQVLLPRATTRGVAA